MQFEVGYILVYEYYHTSWGQGSWRDAVHHRAFLPWDGTESFEDLIKRQHPDFLAKAKSDTKYKHFRIEVISLRVGGEKAKVVMPIENQVIKLTEPAPRRERVM
jgi:hypothetical protein